MTNDFLHQVAEDLKNRGFSVDLREIPTKVNGAKLGLSLAADPGTAVPTFYEGDFKQLALEGFNTTDMGNFVIEESQKMPDFGEIGRLVDKDFVLSRSQLCVANSEWSKDLLAVTPHRPVEGTDLSVYVRIRVGEDATVVPRYEQLDAAGIAPEELLDRAAENSRPTYKVESLDDVIARMFGAEPPAEKTGTYVITNDNAIHGASAITDPEVLAGAYDMIGSDEIYIIPSSVHECLALPANMPPEEVNAMIQEINRTEVKPEDRLGDHAYHYDGKKLTETKTMDRELVAGRSR